jgi:hypothetical protein
MMMRLLLVAVVFMPANVALAGSVDEPAVEKPSAALQVHPYELSLPGKMIEDITGKLHTRVEKEFNACLDLVLRSYELELLEKAGFMPLMQCLTDSSISRKHTSGLDDCSDS